MDPQQPQNAAREGLLLPGMIEVPSVFSHDVGLREARKRVKDVSSAVLEATHLFHYSATA